METRALTGSRVLLWLPAASGDPPEHPSPPRAGNGDRDSPASRGMRPQRPQPLGTCCWLSLEYQSQPR